MYENSEIAKDLGLERNYHLKCRVHVVQVQGKKGKDDSQTFEMTHTILEPLESDERDHFYTAWLPEDDVDPDAVDQEVLATIPWPYNFRKVRLSLAYGNRLFPRIHLLVMDEGASDTLAEHGRGREIKVTILKQSDELRDVGIEID